MSELAEFNIAFLAVELDDSALAPYLEAVGAVITEAEAADGFVWRDQYLAAFEDPNPFGPDALATISLGAHSRLCARSRTRAPRGLQWAARVVPEPPPLESRQKRQRVAPPGAMVRSAVAAWGATR